MIQNFRSRDLQRVFNGEVRRVQPQVAQRIQHYLDVLNNATSLDDLRNLTGFHALKGNRVGYYAVTITRNHRITFGTGTILNEESHEEFHVYDVDYEDYH